MFGRMIKKLYRTSVESKWPNWIVLSVDIDVKVTINGKSNKKFWHSKPEMLKRKLQKKSKQKNSDLKNIVNKRIVVMCLITQKQYGL